MRIIDADLLIKMIKEHEKSISSSEIIDLINNISTINQWNKIEDGPPPNFLPVIISDKQKRVCIRTYWHGRWTKGKHDITHWMLRPEPPTE